MEYIAIRENQRIDLLKEQLNGQYEVMSHQLRGQSFGANSFSINTSPSSGTVNVLISTSPNILFSIMLQMVLLKESSSSIIYLSDSIHISNSILNSVPLFTSLLMLIFPPRVSTCVFTI